jgi:hypothetical protein
MLTSRARGRRTAAAPVAEVVPRDREPRLEDLDVPGHRPGAHGVEVRRGLAGGHPGDPWPQQAGHSAPDEAGQRRSGLSGAHGLCGSPPPAQPHRDKRDDPQGQGDRPGDPDQQSQSRCNEPAFPAKGEEVSAQQQHGQRLGVGHLQAGRRGEAGPTTIAPARPIRGVEAAWPPPRRPDDQGQGRGGCRERAITPSRRGREREQRVKAQVFCMAIPAGSRAPCWDIRPSPPAHHWPSQSRVNRHSRRPVVVMSAGSWDGATRPA